MIISLSVGFVYDPARARQWVKRGADQIKSPPPVGRGQGGADDSTGRARRRGVGWRVGPRKQHSADSVRLLILAVV